AGTYAADVGTLTRPPAGRRPQARRGEPAPRQAAERISFEPGVPWTDPTPASTWRRAWREVSAATPPPGYPDPLGLAELRGTVADYLGRVRGIACTADEVLVTAGTSHGLRLLLGARFDAGARIGVEDPGYATAVRSVRAAGMSVLDCPVDADGLVVTALPERHPPAAVYVTPAHQYPSGGRLPAARRQALVEWARRHDVLVVEDDYDGEFRYDVAPLPALAQLDRDNVVYLGTASKTLGPGLRVGWLVAAADVVRGIARYRKGIADLPPWPAQRALIALFRDGHVDHAVKRARRRYADRRRRVCDVLAPYGTVAGSEAGLHVTLLLPDGVDDRAVRSAVAAAGVDVGAVSDFRRTSPGPSGLVVGYGSCADGELARGLRVLAAVLRTSLGRD
ncbi:MAG TPA: PLP-dependent aminotransferase family protein, partial [Streptosporangiales bacterium]